MYIAYDERYGISVTGGNRIRYPKFTGIGGMAVIKQDEYTIIFSGGGGTTVIGGGSSTNGVTGITVSGSNAISGAININPGQNILLGINGNNITINATGANSDNIAILFGSKELTSGANNETITFPNPFTVTPKVLASIYNNSGQDILGFQLSGITTNGFSVNLSETIPGTGYNLNYFASTGNGLYTFGQSSITTQGGGESNLTGLISTGSADLRYLQTGSSGYFYPWNNPNNFSSSGNVENTGTSLQNRINSLSGYINNSAVSNIVYTTGYQIVSGGKVFTTTLTEDVAISGGLLVGGYTNSAYSNEITQLGFGIRKDLSATQCVQIGYNVAKSGGFNVQSVQIGNSAGEYYTSNRAVQIGYQAGQFQNGVRPVTIGFVAGQNATGDAIVCVGQLAGWKAFNATEGTFVGSQAGLNATYSSASTFIGSNAGANTITGGSGTYIGAYTDVLNTSIDGRKSIAIGYNAKIPGPNVCVIGGSGENAVNVIIGSNTIPVGRLDVSGNIYASGGRVLTVSDEVIKIVRTNKIDFKTTGSYNVYTVPNNQIFRIDTMEVITTDINTASVAPYIKFGNSLDYSAYQTLVETTSNSIYSTHIFANPQDAVGPGTILNATIGTASTANAHSGILLYKGFLITI